MTNRRQNKINEVMGKIAAGLMVDQHINASPIRFSVGFQVGNDMVNNCIVVTSAPNEIMKDIFRIEEAYPGVEVTFAGGRVIINCEHVMLEDSMPLMTARVRQIVGFGR